MKHTLMTPLSLLLLTLFSISSFARLSSRPNHRSHSIRRSNIGSSGANVNQTSTVVEGMRTRRLVTIFDALRPFMSTSDITAWLQTLDSDGKWPDAEVDYTTGCSARRANWPAGTHWRRILLMAAAWRGDGDENAENDYVGNAALLTAISKAMDYWFNRDLTNLQCIHSGGTPACPCDNLDNTLWNTNWFSNVILVPRDVGQICLLLSSDVLTDFQKTKCNAMTSRSYNLFGQPCSFLEGANILDIARLGVDGALLVSNATLISDAYQRIHYEMAFKSEVKSDGIRQDGSFGQHRGLLYNGNYGKDFINGLVDLEIVAFGTEFAAPADIRASFETLIDGSKWMTVRNVHTKTTHWDLSVLSRFLSFPVADLQATAGLRLTLPSLADLGHKWGSSMISDFIRMASKNTTSANAGDFVGNRHFYANDYMVHRGSNYVSTVKGYSSRTLNSECVNTQNPLGFHISDNAVRTYIHGDEYEDIAAAWDWYLIPGATIDYGATPLTCSTTKVTSLENFVGGVSDGAIGISLMRYSNPMTKNLSWQKAWFFLNDDVQHVMLSNLTAASNSSSVRSVIEQRRQRGPIFLNDKEILPTTAPHVQTLWHGDVGYVFSDGTKAGHLKVESKTATGKWATIGTSTQPDSTVHLFSAWIEHAPPFTPLSYSILPGISRSNFRHKREKLQVKTLRNDDVVSAIFDERNCVIFAIFWHPNGGTISFTTKRPKSRSITLVAQNNVALIYKVDEHEITVSDPSQMLSDTMISLTDNKKTGPGGETKTVQIEFPRGGASGRSVTRRLVN